MRLVSSGMIAVGLFAALAAAAGSAGAGENATVMIGKWKLTGEKQDTMYPGSHCQKSALLFASGAEAWLEGGKQVNERLLGYAMSGKDVHVTTMGGEDAYTVIDHDHIQYNERLVACTFTRVK